MCPYCALELTGSPPACPKSGRRQIVLEVETARMEVRGQSVGFVVEGDPESPGGRRVDSQPASGGRSIATVGPEGAYEIRLSGPLEAGRRGEWHVVKTLTKKLKEEGAEVVRTLGEDDAGGEDAVLVIDGTVTRVQITTVPADVWKRLANGEEVVLRGGARTSGDLLREALVRKGMSARGCLLALDARQVGAIIGERMKAEYLEAFGDPVEEFGFSAVWVVGPTPRSSLRLA